MPDESASHAPALSDPLGPSLPPGVHRVRSRLATPALLRRLERAGWSVRMIDLAGAVDKPAILEVFGGTLGFPGWVGHNWDALDDALRDLSWWPAGSRGRAIVVRSVGRATTSGASDRETLQAVLTSAAIRWAATGTPLVVLLRR
jgi:hypothetical protein